MAERPSVSVVVPFAGSATELEGLLVRLSEIRRGADDELIVADNRPAPPDPLPSHPGVLVHPAAGVCSPGFARNRGAAIARGEWVVFIDDDTEPAPDLLDAYFEPLPGERTGVLGGRIVDVLPPSVDGRAPGVAARYALSRGHMDDLVTLGRARFPYAQTANCAVRRSAFDAVGGFVEGIRAGSEDADLCFRLAAEGWGLERRPAAVVGHRARSTVRRSLLQLAHHGSGAAWCNRRHPGSFPRSGARSLAARVARGAGRATVAGARGDREAAAFAALDATGALAFELGRLLPNRAPRRGPRS